MIARFIQRFIQEEHAWDSYVDLLAGIPDNGKPFPDGVKMAKIHWNPKKNEYFPETTVPGTQHDVDFMVRDSKRFADSGNWGWAAFKYDAASDAFTPATVDDEPPHPIP